MENFFEKNLQSLLPRFPAAALLKNQISTDIEFLNTNTGRVTAKFGSSLLHSSYDPVKEANTFSKNLEPGTQVCLYGYGLGYHIESILDRIGPKGFLLIIELNPEILAAAMISRDQTKIIDDPRIHLITGNDEKDVAAQISKYTRLFSDSSHSENWEVMFHSPSFKCIPAHFSKIANALEILLLERRIPTIFGDLEDQNFHYNQESFTESPGINVLVDAYQNQPAMLISAGPSLDDVLPFLKRFQDKALLTCVDTAYPILIDQNLLPDFVFSLDPQDESFEWFCDSIENPFPLVFTPTANAKLIAHHKGPKYVVFKEGLVSSEMNHLSKTKGTTHAGGSVSCLGLDCLIQMGCNPIFLIGQDCAFPAGRTYSRFSKIEEKMLRSVNESQTLAKVHSEKILQRKKIEIKCYSGSQVFSDQILYTYLRNMEEIAQVHPDTKIYNLLSHGGYLNQIVPLFSISEAFRYLETDGSVNRSIKI